MCVGSDTIWYFWTQSATKATSRHSTDTAEKLEETESQYFWKYSFLLIEKNHLIHTCTYKSHKEIERYSESLPTSFCLIFLNGVYIFRIKTKTEFFNSIDRAGGEVAQNLFLTG